MSLEEVGSDDETRIYLSKNRSSNKVYEDASKLNKNLFILISVIEIIAAVFIPFLVPHITETTIVLKLVVGFIGVPVVVAAALLALLRLQEHWLDYRTTCESLKHEKFLFLTKTSPYDSDMPFNLLVEHVEALVSKENSSWAKLLKQKKRKNKPHNNSTHRTQLVV